MKAKDGKFYCNWPRLGESGGKCNLDSNCRDVWHPDNICEVTQDELPGTCNLVNAKTCTGPSDKKSCQLPTIPILVPEKCCHAKTDKKDYEVKCQTITNEKACNARIYDKKLACTWKADDCGKLSGVY